MPCVDVPKVPLPSLPSPLSLGVPSFTAPVVPAVPLCCKIQIPSSGLFSTPPIPLPIGAVLLPIVMVLTAAIGEINSFLDGITPDCPLNSEP